MILQIIGFFINQVREKVIFMNQNIINYYVLANNLKNVVRTGWKEVNISSERIESVADHVYGCLVLAIGLESEYKLDLDMAKVFKMIVIKELEKVNLDKEYTPDGHGNENRREKARNTIQKVLGSLTNKEELIALFDETYEQISKEAKFVYQLSKIESDLQAKIYDLKGEFSLENALQDVKNYGEELSSEILPQVKKASDGWLLFDRRYYTDELFVDLSNAIQNMEDLED